jgi:hypothetical protein
MDVVFREYEPFYGEPMSSLICILMMLQPWTIRHGETMEKKTVMQHHIR